MAFHDSFERSGNVAFFMQMQAQGNVSDDEKMLLNYVPVYVMLLELNAEGVWEVGKWLGAAFAGDEAKVLAHIRSLEERDKARWGRLKFAHPIAEVGAGPVEHL
ncbi:hypothetical protein Ancab_007968 [Ancistrocladus abbreviatus]